MRLPGSVEVQLSVNPSTTVSYVVVSFKFTQHRPLSNFAPGIWISLDERGNLTSVVANKDAIETGKGWEILQQLLGERIVRELRTLLEPPARTAFQNVVLTRRELARLNAAVRNAVQGDL